MNQDLLDILTKWLEEQGNDKFWFIHTDAIGCWPKGSSIPLVAFMIEDYRIIAVEIGIIARNNLKTEYSIYDPNFFDEFWRVLQIHKNVYNNITL